MRLLLFTEPFVFLLKSFFNVTWFYYVLSMVAFVVVPFLITCAQLFSSLLGANADDEPTAFRYFPDVPPTVVWLPHISVVRVDDVELSVVPHLASTMIGVLETLPSVQIVIEHLEADTTLKAGILVYELAGLGECHFSVEYLLLWAVAVNSK